MLRMFLWSVWTCGPSPINIEQNSRKSNLNRPASWLSLSALLDKFYLEIVRIKWWHVDYFSRLQYRQWRKDCHMKKIQQVLIYPICNKKNIREYPAFWALRWKFTRLYVGLRLRRRDSRSSSDGICQGWSFGAGAGRFCFQPTIPSILKIWKKIGYMFIMM